MTGFTYAATLDLNIGYYTIRLDPNSQKICTIILPWGKYLYLRLPMGISGAPDIFQEKMTDLMRALKYVRTYPTIRYILGAESHMGSLIGR